MEIIDLARDDVLIDALVPLSVHAAALSSPRWLPTSDAARAEIVAAIDTCGPDRVCRAILDGSVPLGWAGAFRSHETAWEIHPLLVDPDHHGRGAGRRLVADLEASAMAAGALVMELSTSDATHATTLSDVDLFIDPPAELSRLATRTPGAPHAFRFWQSVGYTVVGVLPDAEGPGVPSLRMARRLTVGGA